MTDVVDVPLCHISWSSPVSVLFPFSVVCVGADCVYIVDLRHSSARIMIYHASLAAFPDRDHGGGHDRLNTAFETEHSPGSPMPARSAKLVQKPWTRYWRSMGLINE